MKISFLVTYYNQKEFVRQSLNSILDITKPCDWEILVGDDGSSDGTIEIVMDYVSRYPNNISLFVMPRDNNVKYDSVKRASANRLNLLEHATGDYFCTLDGDDFYFDKKFVIDAIKVLDENPGVSMVGFGYKYFTNGEYSKDYTLPTGDRGHVDKRKYLKSYYLHSGACVHKLCFSKERIEYIKNIGYYDDNNIVINSLNFGEMYSVNRAIYAYRQTGNSVYTSMDSLEQAILNVQGLDVDLKLIGKQYHNDLLYRYASSIIYMYVWKNKIESILGHNKYLVYSNNCSEIGNSLCYKILNFKNLDSSEQKELKKTLYAFYSKKIIYTVKVLVGYYFGGAFK